jgi:hypothetical protein
MNIKKHPINPRLLVAIGLLMISTSIFIGHFIKFHDFLQGLFGGVGLGLEIMGLIKLRPIQKKDVFC